MLGRKALGTVAYMGGVPAVLSPFCWSWGQMVQFNEEFIANDQRYIHLDKASFSDHGPARNQLAAAMLGDWLIQLDTDHSFEPDIIERMLRTADTYGIDVLSAAYVMKQAPHVPVLYQWVQIGDKEGLQPLAKWPDNCRVVQIGSAGAGCLFVRRSVFDRIVGELHEQPFDKIHPYSEDHSFFLRCRRLGIKCYADLGIESNHLRIEALSLGDVDSEQFSTNEIYVEGFAHG